MQSYIGISYWACAVIYRYKWLFLGVVVVLASKGQSEMKNSLAQAGQPDFFCHLWIVYGHCKHWLGHFAAEIF